MLLMREQGVGKCNAEQEHLRLALLSTYPVKLGLLPGYNNFFYCSICTVPTPTALLLVQLRAFSIVFLDLHFYQFVLLARTHFTKNQEPLSLLPPLPRFTGRFSNNLIA